MKHYVERWASEHSGSAGIRSAKLNRDEDPKTQSQQEHMVHGYLTVRAPVQARVFINDKLSGVTPLNRKLLKVGKHKVEIRNDKLGLTYKRTLRIRAGGTSILKISKEQGILSVNAKPWAKFRVGKSKARDTPYQIELFEGNYIVHAECPNGLSEAPRDDQAGETTAP